MYIPIISSKMICTKLFTDLALNSKTKVFHYLWVGRNYPGRACNFGYALIISNYFCYIFHALTNHSQLFLNRRCLIRLNMKMHILLLNSEFPRPSLILKIALTTFS